MKRTIERRQDSNKAAIEMDESLGVRFGNGSRSGKLDMILRIGEGSRGEEG